MVSFEVLHKDSRSAARLGLLKTAHGEVETPVFMPVGSAGAVKGITPQQLQETGSELILANIYHLLLRPGIETIQKLGGLHKFMAWDGPILTDSGGYQVFSLSPLTKINDDGVEFASHIDGAKTYLNAEIATEIQNRLAVDIITCFDQCTEFPIDTPQLKKAIDRTILWAKRAKQAHSNPDQMLFGIVQGGIDLDLRRYCASELVKTDFDGYAIGGLSVGEGHENMIRTVTHTAQLLPQDKARYLMGVGTPADIIAAVKAGVDMFDCVLPTRNGRNAYAFTENGPLRLRNNVHINDARGIEADCNCYCCYQRLMAKIRQAIRRNEFADWAERIDY